MKKKNKHVGYLDNYYGKVCDPILNKRRGFHGCVGVEVDVPRRSLF